MRTKGKRNVQAQRKFAQGAYVPPSSQQTVERRRETGHNDYNIRNIMRNTRINMSAATLLDHITFANLYPDLQPIVLVERLKNTNVEVSSATSSRRQSPSIDRIRRINEQFNNNFPKLQQRMTRSKSQCSMSTRSRTREAGEKKVKKRVRFFDDFSIDDNRPLMFLSNNTGPKSPAGPNTVPEKSILVHTTPPQEPANKPLATYKRGRGGRNPNTRYRSSGRVEDIPSSAVSTSEEDNTTHRNVDKHVRRPSTSSRTYTHTISNKNIPMDVDVKPFGENKILNPISPVQLSPKSSNDTEIQSKSNNQIVDESSDVIQTMASDTLLDLGLQFSNTANDISSVEESCHHSVSDRAQGNKDALSSSMQVIRSRADTDNSCPSNSYLNARDIISAASNKELKNRCRTCKPCNSINKLLQIASLVEKPLSISQGETNDVYQFDGHVDESLSGLSKSTGGNSSSLSSFDSSSVPIYLDIMSEECTHMIQIMWDKNNDKILRARLVPKSQANVNTELSLNGNGELLDQFINTLNESSQLGMCNLPNVSAPDCQNDSQWCTKTFQPGITSSAARAPEPSRPSRNEVQNSCERPDTDADHHRADRDEIEPMDVIEQYDSTESLTEQAKYESVKPGQLQVKQKVPQHDGTPRDVTKTNGRNSKSSVTNIKEVDDVQNTTTVEVHNWEPASKMNTSQDRNEPISNNTSENTDTELLIPIVKKAKRKPRSNNKEDRTSNTSLKIKEEIVEDSDLNEGISKRIGESRRQSSRLAARNVDCVQTSLTSMEESPQKVTKVPPPIKGFTLRIRCNSPKRSKKRISEPSTSSATYLNQPSTSTNPPDVAQQSEQTPTKQRRMSLASNISNRKTIIDNSDGGSTSSESCMPLHWTTTSKRLFRDKQNTSASSCSNKRSPGTRSSFPRGSEKAELVNALIFYPTKDEFADPISYFEKIMPAAKKYGLCKVVPPDNFNPSCHIKEDMRFFVSNQYIARMYSRWGVAQRELCAIKVNSANQGVVFNKAPLLDCMEVNLLKLYHLVQHNGGLKKVIEKKRWSRIAEDLRVDQCINPEKKLDCIYVKYVLSYDTLTNEERQKMLRNVESCWYKYNLKMLERAMYPLHNIHKLLGESDSSSEEEETMDRYVACALAESEECVVDGRQMNLSMFKKIAANMVYAHFPNMAQPSVDKVENEYWRIVLLAAEHVCVNVASVDTGPQGYGFTKNKNDPYGRHPWNLKVLCQNPANVLRSLNSVLCVSTPTLHLGMCFSCSCWHRDPHGLPWMEYMHSGPGKIWYGIPDEQSNNFRKAVETLCPTSYRNKPIWLPSDITMIPPNLLREHNVSLSRVVQNPGEFIIVFPKAYSCSISTGYTESESAYFATNSWLLSVNQIFQELRESCEPTSFSLEQLLVSVATDRRVSLSLLQQVHGNLTTVINEELSRREQLVKKGIKISYGEINAHKRHQQAWNSRDNECDICRSVLYLSKVMGIITKKSQFCLNHALALIEVRGPKVIVSQLEMILPYSDQDLKAIVSDAVERLMDF